MCNSFVSEKICNWVEFLSPSTRVIAFHFKKGKFPDQCAEIINTGPVNCTLLSRVCNAFVSPMWVCRTVFLPVCLSAWMSSFFLFVWTCLSVYLSFFMPVCLSSFSCLPRCLSVCLQSVWLPCLPVCLVVFLPSCLFVCLSSDCLSALTVCLFVCTPLYPSVCFSVCQPFCLSFLLFVCLPVCVSVRGISAPWRLWSAWLNHSACESVCLPIQLTLDDLNI